MWKVPLSDLLVDDEILDAMRNAAASGWWSMGPRVETFEAAFASYLGCSHAFAVSSGTAALHLALLATGCGPDDEVVLPSLNFVAAANVVRHTGAKPVFCDIRGETDLNLDPGDLEEAISRSTKAIVVLHYGGFSCDIDLVMDLADRHGLVVIEDAAHAPGATWRGGKCGTFGDVGCFSFFSNKNLPIGEGGMVVTNDDALAARIGHLRSHGMTTLTWARHQGHAHTYDVVAPGFNYRLDEVRAAVGIVQLGRLEHANGARAAVSRSYRTQLDCVDGLIMPFGERDDSVSAHHLAVLVLPDGSQREPLRRHLADRRIQTSVHYPPIHRFAAYSGRPSRQVPITEDVADRLLTLPLYPHLDESQITLVVEGVLEFTAQRGPGAH